jgi:protein-S-isoprenylcysteine O-methyltransferase Ste14
LASTLDIAFFVTAYVIIVAFFIIQRKLRQTDSARSFKRTVFEKGSMLLIGAGVGLGFILPLIFDGLRVGTVRVGLAGGALGLLLMLSGLGLRVWAARSLGKYYSVTLRVEGDQKVNRRGPYAWVRHPGYLGEVIMWTGFSILVGNIVLLFLIPLMFLVIFIYRISVEEQMLVKELGADYVQYQKDVRRLIPAIY